MSVDPLEEVVAEALTAAGIRFTREPHNTPPLDFYLPDFGVFVEVKQFHSDRIARQTAAAPNVVVIQGRAAVELFTNLLRRDTFSF